MQPSSDTRAAAAPVPPAVSSAQTSEPITFYHWMVFLLAAAGWMFDCMGQRIFVLSREPAFRELLGAQATDAQVKYWGGIATLLMMVGWATGGIIFGSFSDRYGRVKAMVGTLLAYTFFSGLAGFAHTGTEFLIYRFLFGLGVGGMFGAATTLLAESVPKRFRAIALGSMQTLSAVGNITASALSLKIIPGQENFWGHFSGWQVLSFAGVVPAIFAVPMILILKEPEAWRRAKADAREGKGRVGSFSDLFNHPRWRRNTFVGICLGVAGMVGLWGIAFFSPELITTAFKNRPIQTEEMKTTALFQALAQPANPPAAELREKLDPAVRAQIVQLPTGQAPSSAAVEALRVDLNRIIQNDNLFASGAFQSMKLHKATQNLAQRVQKTQQRSDITSLNRQLVEQSLPGTITELQKTTDQTRSRGTMLQDVGALAGMFCFTLVASYLSRRAAFGLAFTLCICVVSYVFFSLKTAADVYWMLPLMGFATLSVFAGYSIYFPELFPTRLRGTGVAFCYNTVRYAAAPFPYMLAALSGMFPFRHVAMAMCAIYLIGLVALIWAPETKGQPLPED